MTTFTIQPYVGAVPLTFEMTPLQVETVVGPPEHVGINDLGERDETHGKISVRYSPADDKVAEIAFVPGTHLLFQGRSLFDEEDDLVDWLMKHDSQPYEFVGFLIFFALGITVTGFHDQDESQKAITVFQKGRWDQVRSEAVLFQQQ